MADKKLNEVSQLTDFDYALVVKGNDVAKVTKQQLATILGELIGTVKDDKDGLMPRSGFIYRGVAHDANDLIKTGYYRIDSDISNLEYVGYGGLLVLDCGGYIIQVYYSGSDIRIRKKSNIANWTDWITIS